MAQKKRGEINEGKNNAEFIRWFSKSGMKDNSLLGKKGANLGELYNLKLPVPDGFIVTTEAYTNFLNSSKIDEKIKSILDGLDFGNDETVLSASKKIKELILNSEFPEELKEEIVDSYQILGTNKIEIEKGSARDILNNATEPIFVSVRSSVDFKALKENSQKEQSTYLNVKGNDEVLEQVKKSFSSLFNPETIKRELKNGIDKLKIAVVVEKMIDSEKSGIIFSKDSSGKTIINSIWGLGEGMKIKNSFPDIYVLSEELKIMDIKKGEKNFFLRRDSSGSLKNSKSSEERKNSQVLNNYEIQRLGDFAQKIESHFERPQKIEFAIDDAGIHILQSEDYDFADNKKESVKETSTEALSSINDKVNIEKVEEVTKTKLKLFLDSPKLTDAGHRSGLKKVGVLKIEKIIKESGKHPLYFLESNRLKDYEDLIYTGIKKIIDEFEEVSVMTSDFLSDEFSDLEFGKKFYEKNPLLGVHGIRFGLKYPLIFESELNAIKRASEKANVSILLPNLIAVEELQKVRKILNKIKFDDVKVGIVMETPAAVQIIKEFCAEGIDSILINSERLIQNLLSVDKENEQVLELFNFLHPSFLYQIEYLIRVSRRNNIKTNIFGSPTENEDFLKYIIQKGIDFISVYPTEARKISDKISSIEGEIFHGTDKEPRKYEMKKEKEEYIKNSKEDLQKNLERDLKLIEEEKKEYLKETGED